ncbi:MAG: hypothetical protein A2033_01760 [Bacteroidetes bacterium GWA2_31_9]|nr:MAG: hypothetical protein A2033_01760 [Bacteroidetes bacterium GWA2_31_9]
MKYISGILSVLFLLIGFNKLKADKQKNHPNDNTKSVKMVTAGCSPATSSTELDLNNVRALIHTGGDMWWDLQGNPKYEVPAGSGKTALFAGSIWIGGLDVNGQLKIAAQRFRQDGIDYWPGPLITSGDGQGTITEDICRQYDKHFVITRNEVSMFRSWYNSPKADRPELFPSYSVPKIIEEWPAHGDYVSGYPYYLAPFVDVDDDSYYNPDNGDYPYYDLDNKEVCGTSREKRKVRLYGDKTLWWVYNDRGNIHTETGGDAIGMELHGQAFAFSTNDELNNMTFYNYEIINRSTYTLTNTYFGVWTDADLGFAEDDFVGCDVNRGLGYLYNGKAVDGTGQANAYGSSPPAIGVDFFEGPYQDNDNKDNLSNWSESRNLDCNNGYRINPATKKKEVVTSEPSDIENGNINGLNFGDGIADNERWGMRRYIYFNNATGPSATQDPKTAAHHYNYLLGKWRDNSNLLYGGIGWGPTATTYQADFMFPGVTDKCNWGTKGEDMSGSYPNGWSEILEGNQPGDRRFVQSAGPFVLEPGMINDITTGVVWARSTEGNYASVVEVQKADDKAQRLFEVCFKVLDGPDSPDLTFIELDKEIIFNLSNKKTSNNYLEGYLQPDPFIVCPLDALGNEEDCDKEYKFQGYQVFQLKDKDVSISDIYDANKAKLIFQCDVHDGVSQLVNFYWNDELNANEPVEEVDGADNGIIHTFRITEDVFAQGDRNLVNHKKYYFIALAYAHNNFKPYIQTDEANLDGQKLPYKAGRKSADGSIQSVEVIPHIRDNASNGTIMNSIYGDEPAITQLDGFGCGYNEIDLEDITINQIMNGAPWRSEILKYKVGKGPIKIKVTDPLNVPTGEYILKFIPDSVRVNKEGYYYYNPYFNKDTLNYDPYSYIVDAKWVLTNKNSNGLLDKDIYSDAWISLNNEQLIPELGLSISIEQTPYSFPAEMFPNQPACTKKEVAKNGYINSSIEFSDPSKPWLIFAPDADSHNAQDWIKAGTDFTDPTSGDCNWYYNDRPSITPLFTETEWLDKEQIFESMVQGTWAPYRLVSYFNHAPGELSGQGQIKSKEQRLANIDIIITKDTSLWTRCPVLETTDNKYKRTACGSAAPTDSTLTQSGEGEFTAENRQLKLNLRSSPSVDKLGNIDNSGTLGMGWFPGYVIDVETGERLNMMFGESSRLTGDNGRDMKWNPSPRFATDLYFGEGLGEPILGGKHFIYIMGHNIKNTTSTKYEDMMPAYDKGEKLLALLNENKIKEVFMNCMYVSIPVLNQGYEYLACDVKIRLRVVSPYRKRTYTLGFAPDSIAPNRGFPMYSFSTNNLATTKNDLTTLQNSLDLINIVPNPYYAHNSYELTQIDHLVKFTNLPQICTISIYSVNGTLIRRFEKDNSNSYVEWDLKNTHGISISGGVYVIHVEIPGVGERFLKWFGALRPIDLNSF